MWMALFLCVLSQKIPAVLGGRDALGLFEHLGEHPVVGVAGLLRHLRDGQGCGQQQLFRLLHADVGEIRQEIDADLAFEQLADVLWVQVKFLRQHAKAHFLGQMLLQIAGNAVDGAFLLTGRLPRGLMPEHGDLQIVNAPFPP